METFFDTRLPALRKGLCKCFDEDCIYVKSHLTCFMGSPDPSTEFIGDDLAPGYCPFVTNLN